MAATAVCDDTAGAGTGSPLRARAGVKPELSSPLIHLYFALASRGQK